MDKYIGFKLIEATPMTLGDYKKSTGSIIPSNADQDGYQVKYPDGYISWSPKEVFEAAYLKVVNNVALKSGVSISQEMVNNFIKDVDVQTLGEKTTLVRVTLINGFELVEASSCVDPANYDENLGKKCCMEKIKDKIWYLLGFLLQTAVNGIK
jgi:hypothetical protein